MISSSSSSAAFSWLVLDHFAPQCLFVLHEPAPNTIAVYIGLELDFLQGITLAQFITFVEKESPLVIAMLQPFTTMLKAALIMSGVSVDLLPRPAASQ